MNHATEKDLNDIMEVFKIHKDVFPHVRSDKIERMIDEGNVVWVDDVVITYNRYKRSQKIGTHWRPAQKGDCILHQIAAKNQGDGSAKKVFLRFLEFNKGRDVWLTVRAENKRAIAFYEKQNFTEQGDIEWGKENQIKGKVFFFDVKPFYTTKDTDFNELVSN